MTVQEKYERSCRVEESALILVLGITFCVLLYAVVNIIQLGLQLGAFE